MYWASASEQVTAFHILTCTFYLCINTCCDPFLDVLLEVFRIIQQLHSKCFVVGVIQSANVAGKIPTTQEISCCGLAISPDLTKVAVGDMTGNVWIYRLGEVTPCHHQNVCTTSLNRFYHYYINNLQIGVSVRCLIWCGDATIFIGDLGGNIYKWNITGSIVSWVTLEGSVIHIRQSHNKKVTYYYKNQCPKPRHYKCCNYLLIIV